jgi:hypothetical protein
MLRSTDTDSVQAELSDTGGLDNDCIQEPSDKMDVDVINSSVDIR